MKDLALLICGALGKEVKTMVNEHGWDVDIYGVPALHHFYPKKIVEAVDRKLEQLSTGYRQVVVVYGDCGTAGALEPVLERYAAVRVRGPHCYEMFAGSDFDRIADERPATFFLTDWLVRNFERAVVRGLGLESGKTGSTPEPNSESTLMQHLHGPVRQWDQRLAWPLLS